MNIIFCRHGETEFNLFDRFQGVSDSPLTERGREQAHKINIFLKKSYHVAAFYISPLPRVHQTYEIASKGISASVIVVPELREVCYGEWETKKRDEIDPTMLQEKEKDKFGYVHPGEYQGISGESYEMTYERVLPFLKDLEELDSEEDIVVISHQGVMRGVYKYFFREDDPHSGNFKNSNHQVIVVTIQNGEKKVEIRDLG